MRSTLFPASTGYTQLTSIDTNHFPGRISLGDISSDGYPDMLITVKAENGTSSTFLMLNSPCLKSVCSQEARQARRRVFKQAANAYEKFMADDEDLDDSVINSLFEGQMNFTDVFEAPVNDYAVTSDEFGLLLK